MKNKSNIFFVGTAKGALVGLALSTSYLLYLVAFFSLILQPSLWIAVFVGLYGLMFGVVPAIVLGATAGTLIALLYFRRKPEDESDPSRLGVLVPISLLILVVILVSLWSSVPLPQVISSFLPLLAFYAIPIAMFIAAGVHFVKDFHNTRVDATVKLRPFSSYKRTLAWLYIPPLLVILGLVSMRIYPILTGSSQETLDVEVSWYVSQTNSCPAYVDLEFVAAQGYGISTCSQTLADSLQAAGVDVVHLSLMEEKTLIAWRYTVVRVGNWESTNEEWFGVWLSCSSTEPTCGSTPPPVKDPFNIFSNNQ